MHAVWTDCYFGKFKIWPLIAISSRLILVRIGLVLLIVLNNHTRRVNPPTGDDNDPEEASKVADTFTLSLNLTLSFWLLTPTAH